MYPFKVEFIIYFQFLQIIDLNKVHIKFLISLSYFFTSLSFSFFLNYFLIYVFIYIIFFYHTNVKYISKFYKNMCFNIITLCYLFRLKRKIEIKSNTKNIKVPDLERNNNKINTCIKTNLIYI